jgi:hypothetical protein
LALTEPLHVEQDSNNEDLDKRKDFSLYTVPHPQQRISPLHSLTSPPQESHGLVDSTLFLSRVRRDLLPELLLCCELVLLAAVFFKLLTIYPVMHIANNAIPIGIPNGPGLLQSISAKIFKYVFSIIHLAQFDSIETEHVFPENRNRRRKS